jgi:hypothetical protein
MPSYTNKTLPRPKRTKYVTQAQFAALLDALGEAFDRLRKLEGGHRRILITQADCKRQALAEATRLDRVVRDMPKEFAG